MGDGGGQLAGRGVERRFPNLNDTVVRRHPCGSNAGGWTVPPIGVHPIATRLAMPDTTFVETCQR
jgi:hypothetical protein